MPAESSMLSEQSSQLWNPTMTRELDNPYRESVHSRLGNPVKYNQENVPVPVPAQHPNSVHSRLGNVDTYKQATNSWMANQTVIQSVLNQSQQNQSVLNESQQNQSVLNQSHDEATDRRAIEAIEAIQVRNNF